MSASVHWNMTTEPRVEYHNPDVGEPFIRVGIRVDSVPYYGSATTLSEALAQLVRVLDDHGAPRPRGPGE